jgi:hypothetical protein
VNKTGSLNGKLIGHGRIYHNIRTSATIHLGRLCKISDAGKIVTHRKTDTVQCAWDLDRSLGFERLGWGGRNTENEI